ncbi:oxidoreductase [bacterium]|nr:MAG: oxidoreductase [bacterium]
METLYHQLGGFDVIFALTRRWHELCLLDPEASHPFEHGMHPYHDERLAAYLAEAFGGPKLYSAGYGDESSMQRIHSGNGDHLELDEACVTQFERAVREVGISGEAADRVCAYFRRATEGQRVWSAQDAEVPHALPFNYA